MNKLKFHNGSTEKKHDTIKLLMVFERNSIHSLKPVDIAIF